MIDLEQFTDLVRRFHLQEGVELLSTHLNSDGSVGCKMCLPDGKEAAYTIPVLDVLWVLEHPGPLE